MKRAEAFISATARALACASALVCAQGFAADANSVAAREPQSVMVAQAATPEAAPTAAPAAAVQTECDRLAAPPVPLAPTAPAVAKTPVDWSHAIEVCTAEVNANPGSARLQYELGRSYFQNKNYLTVVHEFQRMTRIIPLDGRPHRKDIEPSYYGDPVGHWEGDTLVIETNNFKRWTLDDYFYTDPKQSRMHSDALVTTERMTWKDQDTISYQITINDPKIFSAPWSQDFTIKSHPDWEQTGLYEYICEENNRCPGGRCQGK